MLHWNEMSHRCRCAMLAAALGCGGAEQTTAKPSGASGAAQDIAPMAQDSVTAAQDSATAVEDSATAVEDSASDVNGSATAVADSATDVDGSAAEPAAPAGDTAAEASTERGAAAWRASYSVPVPVDLEPYATFELDDLRFRQRGDEWTLDYSLPALLLGASQKLSFRGSIDASGAYVLSGDAGSLTCIAEADTLRCDEVLAAVELDREKLERALAEFPATENQARWDVAERFADDPIGVLRFAR
jgi:hypothetical protein